MRVSAWVTASDLVTGKATKFEKLVTLVSPKKRRSMYKSAKPEYIFSQFKKSGVDGLELLIPILTTDEDVKKIKDIIEKNNIPVLSIHQALTSVNKISLQEIERLCLIARNFGAHVVVLHSGSLGKKLFDKTIIDRLHDLQKKYHITFGIENMPKSPFNLRRKYAWKPDSFLATLTKDDLSITLDTTHLAQVGEDICDFFEKNYKKIVNIHLSSYKKDWHNRKLLLQKNTHLPLYQGELPVKKFLHLLKQKQYKGLITMEINADLSGLCECAKIIHQEID